MIIDDDYIQYEAFRIVNKADTDAIAAFRGEPEKFQTPQEREAELARWQVEAERLHKEAEGMPETEESLYNVTYAERMVRCWTNYLQK